MHYIKEASQNACVCIFLCINILISNFGSYLPSVAFLLAYILTFVTSQISVSINRGKIWIYSFEWLVLIRHVTLLSAICQGITEVLVLLSKPHPLDSLIPTLYLPKEIISLFIITIILILLCFGLEGSTILDGLVYGCISGAVFLYTTTSITIHATGHFASPHTSPFNISQVLLVCALLKPFFIETSIYGPTSRIWSNTITFVVYFFITLFMPSFDDILCVQEGQIALLCPINSKYKWYELSMGCLALIGFGCLAPSLASKPILSLVTPSRLGLHFTSEGTNIIQTNFKALVFIGMLIFPLTYWTHIYQLFFINSIAYWLQELLSSLSYLFYCYTPVYTEPSRIIRRSSPYEPVTETVEDFGTATSSSFQDIILSDSESSDTDIDSIVEEYHDKIKVLQGMGKEKKSPTELTGKTSYCCLAFISGLSLCISLALILQFYKLAFYSTLGLITLIVVLLCLPRRNIINFKATLLLIMNCCVANIMLVPLFNTFSMVISLLLIGIGVIFVSAPYAKKKISAVKMAVKLRVVTNNLYCTQAMRVQRTSVQT